MLLTDEKLNAIGALVYDLYLPSDICNYLRLDYFEFIEELRKKEELYNVFYNRLFDREKSLKNFTFSATKDTIEAAKYLNNEIVNYKTKLKLELNN